MAVRILKIAAIERAYSPDVTNALCADDKLAFIVKWKILPLSHTHVHTHHWNVEEKKRSGEKRKKNNCCEKRAALFVCVMWLRGALAGTCVKVNCVKFDPTIYTQYNFHSFTAWRYFSFIHLAVVVGFSLYAGFVKFLVYAVITPTCKLAGLGQCLVNKASKEDLKILNAPCFSNTFNCTFFSRNFNHRKCSKTARKH